jgi:quercetin dioxygenase-like cupin family protein
MRKLWLLVMGALAIGGVSAFGAASAQADDIVKAAPDHAKVLLDNEHVRVIEVRTKPGDKITMHSHPAYVLYSLTSGKARFTSPDGKTTDRDLKKGQAIWSDGVAHATENTGKSESRVLLVELKEPAKK